MTSRSRSPSLEGGEWVVVEHLDDGGALEPIDEGLSASARFADGRIAGSGGCNRYTGTFKSVGGGLAINNGRGGVVSLVIDTRADARFGEDGRLAGFGGCNRVFGPYEVDADAIRIGPLASGRMMCPEPEGLMDQEAAFVAALQNAATWSIDDGRLQLRDADGALQVDFRPADEAGNVESG